MIRLATVFSGIGAIEHALQRMQIRNEIVFACDNGDLEIKLDDLDTSNATFIKYISNGVNMELVAIKDSQNNIDVAFNTCQVCNGAPKAYFVQKK